MHKILIMLILVSIAACSGAKTSGGRAKAPAPVTAGPVDIQLEPRERGLVEHALAALNPGDREFVEMYTSRIVWGEATVANLGTGTTVVSEAHIYMSPAQLGGVIVHEACHHWQSYVGRVTNGRSAESECNVMRREAEVRAV